MAKEQHIEVDGIVINALPNAMFKVELENKCIVTCNITGKIRMNYIKILQGDKVRLQMSSYDLSKARIIYRY
ncbi:translation initiation factor IF-1 [Candidatus Karelsulcia muelleri]|uniref:Translation initiation factor IF-1 n=3 Tax=Candidatus Karelsulcia muelleri TaxID=336810 RepID=A0A088MZI9_9FLAO|nr:translation initiation factor IF-1 [Candidatus Karelsulcia muelleri]ABS30637.1 translation initiation factor IF-1 [Candidatus Karelsulcia muelleri GWSS]ADE35515.1 bacterial translation initiation factor 1 (bIF-1) [Candidatus Karelsulcia muelleri DMIN]AGS33463.1 initiation factor 1 [Candidatus Karelsulcia muelleri str. Sulcia-ALF]EAT14138.1 translation initiation factor IF-1 [Candidatus Karelsulcia muelleri str. Hc (Homalodisca coagulata)]AIN47780.1 Translation initiation factor 1 [Candidatu